MTAVLIVLGVFVLMIAIVLMYGITIYNGLVSLKRNADKAWSNIDVLLKQRFDEIPKLVKVCEGYMQHERQTLEAVIKARSAISGAKDDKSKLKQENFLSETLKSLFAVTESYPELKADGNFRNLSNRISLIEDQISDRRELFNQSITNYNVRIEQFPDVIIARMFAYQERDLWKIDPAHRQDVDISFSNG